MWKTHKLIVGIIFNMNKPNKGNLQPKDDRKIILEILVGKYWRNILSFLT